ncbi:ribbon-helix-helix protein, CopG family [Mumia sp. DW29H23]|uniref:ribbon-helix-helix protein, CopG family n=1 Tax=Mumia sp. DW29H23 TaxID=3421241 RepID=UPI003D694625
MAGRGTPIRAFRIPDDLFESAREIADRRGESLSDVVRDLLERWVAEHVNDERRL